MRRVASQITDIGEKSRSPDRHPFDRVYSHCDFNVSPWWQTKGGEAGKEAAMDMLEVTSVGVGVGVLLYVVVELGVPVRARMKRLFRL